MTTPRRASELWSRLDVTVRDLPLGLLLLVGSLVPALQGNGTVVGGLPDRPYDALAAAAIALQSLPLAVRRRWPLACLVLVVAGFALDQSRGYHAFAGTGLVIALFSAGAHLERRRRTVLIALSAAYAGLAVALDRLGGTEPVEGYVLFYLALALAWGMGAWLRSSRAAEAERRRLIAEATRAAERASIARELHDVVTHHVTAMVVQAEAARYLTTAPDRLDRTLTVVSATGRRAITDLRHLLDLLDPGPDEAPNAPVDGLLALVEQTRRAGQPVEFAEEGTPQESTGSADLVAHRVVQEALTNALKHAHGSPTSVLVRHGHEAIDVEVSTEDSAAPGAAVGGSGRGLAGLRERVAVLGGEFSAEPSGGGFVVRARIPTGSPS